jgi:DNA repair exonuclease SbcCD ATPase subunit
MIRALALTNWRSFADVSVEFGPGTTFVVASNGVGKTSLVEAARWALFGRLPPGGATAIRVGESVALATVRLDLPDGRMLSVQRTLARGPRRAGPAPVVHLDGTRIPHPALEPVLAEAFGAEPAFMAALAMPALDRHDDSPAAMGLEEHLGRYYGVEGLREAVAELKAMRRANDVEIKRIKATHADSSQRLARLQRAVDAAVERAEAAISRHKLMQARADRARDRARVEAELERWKSDHAAWLKAGRAVARRLSSILDRRVGADEVDDALLERLAELGNRLESVRIEVATRRGRAEALAANDARLDAAHEDCPVCRRPLDETTVTLAHRANSAELSALRRATERLAAQEAALLAERDQLQALRTEWRRLPRPGDPPPTPEGDAEQSSAAELDARTEAALDELVDARAALAAATQKLEESRAADEAMRALESLFTRDAELRVAVEATESTLAELLDETIRPLAVEVDQRWKALFPGRGDLDTHSDGSITRLMNGHPLPYDSFSTGESAGAMIVLRLLAAQMATTADFCWFDEPLEHLDPDVRRKVANLLSRVTGAESPLKQVVVTTYEEPLARHLQARDSQRVSLFDIRQAV